jgi:hypothetical protein
MGTFRWQLQPYSNVVTLSVVQQGGQYQLDGIDNQCGAVQSASVRGMAFPNQNGTIGFGLTIVTAPGGTPVHVDATLGLPSLNGTWRDSAGNAGHFIFGAGIPGGGPRPVLPGGLAPGSVTTIQIAPAAVTSAQIAPNAITSASIADGSVTIADLVAAPAVAGHPSTYSNVPLSSSPQIVRSVTLQIPANGTVVANAAGLFGFSSSSISEGGWCSITPQTSMDEGSYLLEQEWAPDALAYVSFGGTRFFSVTPGAFTVRLVCVIFNGATVVVHNPTLNALFIPM